MTGSVKRRAYDSSGRREAARLRRRRIVQAARTRFLTDGYAATTIAAVAEDAGVSQDLVFRLFANKRGLLKDVMDVAIGGDDDDMAMLDRPGPQAVRAATDQREQIRLFALGMTDQLARVHPLNEIIRSAAAVEPDVAALRDDLHLRQRKLAMNAVAEWLLANGPLCDGTSLEDATSIIWTLASPDTYRALTIDCGWTDTRFAQWLEQTLTATLLPS